MTILEPNYKWAYAPGNRSITTHLILHHAAATGVSAETIHRWHLNNGWAGIAYHYYVRKDGSVYRGRPEAWSGGHTTNWNYCSIGICFEGNFENEAMPEAQRRAGTALVADIRRRYPSITVGKHSQYQATACLPVDKTELLMKTGWKQLSDVQIGDKIATAHIDNLHISFSPVLGKMDEHTNDTWEMRGLEATADHRVLSFNQTGKQTVTQYKDLFNASCGTYLPSAGYFEGKGLDICDDEIELLIAVQADGHYMRDGNSHYGVEFHLKKKRKILRITELLDRLDIDYVIAQRSDKTVSIRAYGKKIFERCEQHLKDKHFTWRFIDMSPEQATFFLDKILDYDGCRANNSYSSRVPENIDIVSAIAALNGVGVLLGENKTRIYFKKDKRSLGVGERKRIQAQRVSCVTVESGFILIRQDKRTTIVGNCPGAHFPFDEIVAGVTGEPADTDAERSNEPSEWARASCDKAVAAGLIQGDTSGWYGWQEPVTKEMFAVLADRLGMLN